MGVELHHPIANDLQPDGPPIFAASVRLAPS
jgi:hypothetical protein